MRKAIIIAIGVILVVFWISLIYSAKDPEIAEFKRYKMPENINGESYGIDVSHHQGKIAWDEVDSVDGKPIEFVFIRASVGVGGDKQFNRNWRLTEGKFLRGAYHFYNPNVNSYVQAHNFMSRVELLDDDLPPVLDIEWIPKVQSIASMRIGLKRWLRTVEDYYGKKPIIYTNDSYWRDYLRSEFSDYTLWVANYNKVKSPYAENWEFWQFTDKGRVDGIDEYVDINIRR